MLFPIDLQLNRSIIDAIHGTIRLSNDEMNIIEHPLFRRLHHVRQNSFLFNVFPAAKHTRFEHSIGVMHCAHQMLMAVLDNGKIARQREDIANPAQLADSLEQGVGIDLYSHLVKDADMTKSVFYDLRIAALLHDVGHGPLSHLFDSYAPKMDDFIHILQRDDAVQGDARFLESMMAMLENDRKRKRNRQVEQVRVQHEHVSVYFAYKILCSLGYEISHIHRVLTILKPELDLESFHIDIFGHRFNLTRLLSDIVAGAPIDCDRMDYLKRDSTFAGVPYGDYSEDRVLKTLLAYAKDGEIRLGLKNSGLHAIESVLIARYQMYVQVYGHKTNEACQAMLEFIGQGDDLDFTDWSGCSPEKFAQLYVELSDEGFLNALKGLLQQKGLEQKKDTIERLVRRDLWKRVYEAEEYVSSKDEETAVKRAFDQAFAEMEKEFSADTLFKHVGERFPLKDLDESGARLLEKKSHGYYVVDRKALSASSQIIESLNKGLRILRIYALDQNKVKAYREYARKHIHPRIAQAEGVGPDKDWPNPARIGR